MRASEPLILDGAPRGLTPGAVTMALHAAHGVPVEAIGAIGLREGALQVEVDVRQGRRLVTPCPLIVGGSRVVLRRPSDLAGAPPAWTLTIDAGPSLGAGALAIALHEASEIRGEDVGTVRAEPGGALRVELDRWRHREQDLPQTVAGRPTAVEKKKPRRLTRACADTAAMALERALAASTDPERLRQVTREALTRSGSDPRLGEAARRLARVGFAPPAPAPAADPGMLLLTLALAPREAWLRELERLDATPFPTPEDRAAREAVASLDAELRSLHMPSGPLEALVAELAARHGLETRVGGTLVPGLRALGVRVAPPPPPKGSDPVLFTTVTPPTARSRPAPGAPQSPYEGYGSIGASRLGCAITPSELRHSRTSRDDLMSRWLAIATALLSPDGLDPAVVRTLDRDIRTAYSDVGHWPELKSLVMAEAAGRAEPAHTALEDAVAGTPRYEAAAVRLVDSLALAGRFQEASAAAQRAAKAGALSPRLVRRLLRLGARVEGPAADAVSRVLQGEALWRGGRRLEAQVAFQSARPTPGSPAAVHAASRLLAQGQSEAAWVLLDTDSDSGLRLRAAVATSRWAEAAEAWAEQQGASLGLEPPPDWADAAVRIALPNGLDAVVEGRLTKALEALSPGRVRALCERALSGAPALASSAPAAGAAAVLLFETPDPKPALRALSSAGAAKGLLLRLVREIDAWDADTALALAQLPAEQRRELLVAVPEATWLEWLEGKDAALRGAAVALLDGLAELPAPLEEALAKTPERRIEAARALLAEGRRDEAAQVAASAFRRAGLIDLRRAALRVVAGAERWHLLEALLDPARDAHVHADVIEVLLQTSGVPQSMAPAVERLQSEKMERVRLAAGRLLATLRD